jgi:PEP-CTERM motif
MLSFGPHVAEEALMRFIAVALTAVVTLLAASAHADVINVSLEAGKFGRLDQSETNCAAVNCGPTAAVNSFVYLQSQFPTVYTTPLVPVGKEKDVANTLNSDFMKTCPPGPDCAGGTAIEDFILGKMDYIEKLDKGVTRYHAQMTETWNPITHPGAPKPDFVDDNTRPTIDFLGAELKAGEDIELALKPRVGDGHFVTLTGLTFDTETRMGTITFVDPKGGKVSTANITREAGENVSIVTDYMSGDLPSRIVGASAQSPKRVPEPSTVVLLGGAAAGLIALGWKRRR